MEALVPNRLSVLGHPQRLAVFRLLMRRYPDRVPATELARALALKPNTLSNYVGALLQADLLTQERLGTSLRYAINMDVARETFDYLLLDCCRARPEICAFGAQSPEPQESKMMTRKYNVLFICTGNSARSIFAEAILRDVAPDRFVAYSAGSHPSTDLNPFAVDVLGQKGHDVSVLRAKHMAEYQGADAPRFDFVFTVCDQAANEECPSWPGQPVTAHWGLPDPVKATGTDAEKSLAFHQTFGAIRHRIIAFTSLPFATLERIALQKAIDNIGQNHEGAST